MNFNGFNVNVGFMDEITSSTVEDSSLDECEEVETETRWL